MRDASIAGCGAGRAAVGVSVGGAAAPEGRRRPRPAGRDGGKGTEAGSLPSASRGWWWWSSERSCATHGAPGAHVERGSATRAPRGRSCGSGVRLAALRAPGCAMAHHVRREQCCTGVRGLLWGVDAAVAALRLRQVLFLTKSGVLLRRPWRLCRGALALISLLFAAS